MWTDEFKPYFANKYLIKFVTQDWERKQMLDLRQAVFCAEQGIFAGDDLDNIDKIATPIVAIACVASLPDHVVGTVRIHEEKPGVWWVGLEIGGRSGLPQARQSRRGLDQAGGDQCPCPGLQYLSGSGTGPQPVAVPPPALAIAEGNLGARPAALSDAGRSEVVSALCRRCYRLRRHLSDRGMSSLDELTLGIRQGLGLAHKRDIAEVMKYLPKGLNQPLSAPHASHLSPSPAGEGSIIPTRSIGTIATHPSVTTAQPSPTATVTCCWRPRAI
jgi:hypothetical protein